MKEILYEESAKIQNEKSAATKYYVLKVLSIISYTLAVLWFMLVFIAYDLATGSALLNIIFIVVPLAMFIASGIVLGKFKNKFYVDYDYIFVSGSIRFSKVIKNVSRKFICKFECSTIEKIGKIGSGTFEKYSNMPDVKRHILTMNSYPAEGKDFYYIVANFDGEKKLFVLECTETFMVNVLKFSNKMVLEEDYKK
ncbi:MAG: hypothetical protein E7346_03515 [Clostridiales bacterium]|nr:hypothetical protein [Clostridiales bacterium]